MTTRGHNTPWRTTPTPEAPCPNPPTWSTHRRAVVLRKALLTRGILDLQSARDIASVLEGTSEALLRHNGLLAGK